MITTHNMNTLLNYWLICLCTEKMVQTESRRRTDLIKLQQVWILRNIEKKMCNTYLTISYTIWNYHPVQQTWEVLCYALIMYIRFLHEKRALHISVLKLMFEQIT